MIENLLNRLERFFKNKRPLGKFSRYNLFGDVPNGDFVDEDFIVEFRETDSVIDVDVRFFNPNDNNNFVGYVWNTVNGDYDRYLLNGPEIPMSIAVMEKIRYISNNALSFIEKIDDLD